MFFELIQTFYKFTIILPKNKKINLDKLYYDLKPFFPVFYDNESKFKYIKIKTEDYSLHLHPSGKIKVFVKGNFNLLVIKLVIEKVKEKAFNNLTEVFLTKKPVLVVNSSISTIWHACKLVHNITGT